MKGINQKGYITLRLIIRDNMNNFPFYIPSNINNNYYNCLAEIEQLKEKIKILENKIKKIEKEKEENYLKKDDNYYMI